MAYEYKCVAAPERARSRKGARGRTERVAAAMQDLIRDEAVDGWEYLRTDLLPVEEKSSWFSRPHEAHRAVLVFRRGEAAVTPAERAPERAPRLRDLSRDPEETPEPVLKLAARRGQDEDESGPRVAPPTGLS